MQTKSKKPNVKQSKQATPKNLLRKSSGESGRFLKRILLLGNKQSEASLLLEVCFVPFSFVLVILFSATFLFFFSPF